MLNYIKTLGLIRFKFNFMKRLYFVSIFMFPSVAVFVQYDYMDSNIIEVSFGINQFTLNINDL
jgi:hypothetical protein